MQVVLEKKPNTARKIICLTIGFILTINAVFMTVLSNMTIGIVGAFLLGIVFLLCGIVKETIFLKIPKWLKHLFLSGVTVVIISTAFLLIYGSMDTATYQEDAVIVLGSGIKGEKLSAGLKGRLDSAIAYFIKNPEAVIVLSGGQGPQEDIPECLAMERYLLSKGIPQEKIIIEERAKSTYENFVFTKELLDGYFDTSYSVVFVTSEYHVFRAGSIAKSAGLTDVSSQHSGTKWYTLIPSCLRECVGVLKFWLFKN